jgi:hypothetical protein
MLMDKLSVYLHFFIKKKLMRINEEKKGMGENPKSLGSFLVSRHIFILRFALRLE